MTYKYMIPDNGFNSLGNTTTLVILHGLLLLTLNSVKLVLTYNT